MSKLKTDAMRKLRKPTVLKKRDFGRCYNNIDGEGWIHRTKGVRVRHATSERISAGYAALSLFLDLVLPKRNSDEEVINQLNQSIEDMKEGK